MSAKKGNTNAQQGEVKASSWVQCRVTPKEKSCWVRKSQSEGRKLCELLKNVMNKYCGGDE